MTLSNILDKILNIRLISYAPIILGKIIHQQKGTPMTRYNVEIEDKEEFERIEKEYQRRISEALDPIISELHNALSSVSGDRHI